MVRYQNTINTNISWIPQIPNHWNLMKVNALFQERKCKVSDKVFSPLSVTKKGILPQLEHAAKTNNGDNRKLVKAGDFVINSRSDRKSSCGVSQLDGSVSLINIVLTPREELNGKYIHYLLRNYRFSEEYYRNGRGIVADLWTTRYSEIKSILLPVPPRTEQEQIVRFLDWKVSEINKLIGIKQKQISRLTELQKAVINETVTHGLNKNAPMKFSGVEWIGNIPNHWECTSIKRKCTQIGSGTTPSTGIAEYYSGNINWIQSGDLYQKKVISSTAKHLSELAIKNCSALSVYRAPYIVIAMYGASIGNVAVSLIDACVNQACCVLIPNKDINVNFLLYWMMCCKENFLQQGVGGTQPNISQVKIKDQVLICPPLDEQNKIVSFLNLKISEIDELIEVNKKQMQELSD